jgi:hypothetical protein
MKTKSLILFSFFIIAFSCAVFVFHSCSKENLTNRNSEKSIADILCFKNYEEYKAAQETIIEFTAEQRASWETSHNFTSFGSLCNEIYAKANPANFSSIVELESFVTKNNAYIRFYQEDNGELTLERVLYRNPLRYLINKDRMLIVNNSICKVLEKATVVTTEDNIDALRSIDEQNLESARNNPDFVINWSDTDDDIDTGEKIYDCGRHVKEWNDNGNDRTTLWIDIDRYSDYIFKNDPNTYTTHYQVNMDIKPYHRTLGIWYNVGRHIWWDVKLILAYSQWCTTWQYVNLHNYDSDVSSDEIWRIMWNSLDYGIFYGGWVDPLCRQFTAIDAWADTPSTGPASHKCNEGAINF